MYGQDTIRGKFHEAGAEAAQSAADERKFKHTGLKLVAGAGPGAGANRPPPSGPSNPSIRVDLFATLQYSKPVRDPRAAEDADSWMGHTSYDPRLGRIAPPAPTSKGRRDLFDIIQNTGKRKPGDYSGDAWIGNAKVGRCRLTLSSLC